MQRIMLLTQLNKVIFISETLQGLFYFLIVFCFLSMKKILMKICNILLYPTLSYNQAQQGINNYLKQKTDLHGSFVVGVFHGKNKLSPGHCCNC